MPCSDGQQSFGSVQYVDRIVEKPVYIENPVNVELQQEKTVLMAMVCALLTQYREEHEATEFRDFVERAEENGQVKITPFWEQHQMEDVSRLKESLKKFSQHEIELIKLILKENQPL